MLKIRVVWVGLRVWVGMVWPVGRLGLACEGVGMIARAKRRADDEVEAGFLPLHDAGRGRLVPISREVVSSWEAAVEVCISAVWQQVQELACLVEGRLALVRDNLSGLVSLPDEDTDVWIEGVCCEADGDGVVVLPERAPEEDGVYSSQELEEAVGDALAEVMEGEPKVKGAGGLADLLADLPLEVLSTIQRNSPEMLGEIARFLVRLHRERGSVAPLLGGSAGSGSDAGDGGEGAG